jgi:CheY-like chemotaxis protein
MLNTIRYAVIEDNPADLEEVGNQVCSAGLDPRNLLALAGTYEDARRELERHARELDLVFLDLRLPRDGTDANPERAHGNRLLDLIHEDLNRRPDVRIRVIVISGEDIQDGLTDDNLRKVYRKTLVEIAPKRDLPRHIQNAVKQLLKDPLLERVKNARIDIVDPYETLVDTSLAVDERLMAAKRLVCRLICYDGDYGANRPGACLYGDDLNAAIKDLIEDRFTRDSRGGLVRLGNLTNAHDHWGQFLWRGAIFQHLYTINSYRNIYEHLAHQP